MLNQYDHYIIKGLKEKVEKLLLDFYTWLTTPLYSVQANNITVCTSGSYHDSHIVFFGPTSGFGNGPGGLNDDRGNGDKAPTDVPTVELKVPKLAKRMAANAVVAFIGGPIAMIPLNIYYAYQDNKHLLKDDD